MKIPRRPDHFPWALRDSELVPFSELTLHVEAHAMRYALSVFEGVRAYTPAAGGRARFFELEAHLARLRQSLALVELPAVDTQELERNLSRLLSRVDARTDCYLRIAATATSSGTLHAPMEMTTFATLKPMGRKTWLQNGKRMRLAIGPRKPEGTLLPHTAKIIAHYAGSHRALRQAVKAGYDSVLLLDHRGYVAEAPTSNIIFVFGDEVVTPGLDHDILAGVTRGILLDIARNELGQKVAERPVRPDMLDDAAEALLCGTGIEIAPIQSIGEVNLPADNPVTTALVESYLERVRR